MRRFFQGQSGSFGPYVEGGLTRVPAPSPRVSANSPAVVAVIVCYEPERELLVPLVEGLLAQTGVQPLLVDNSELEVGRVSARAVAEAYGLPLIANPRNLGVAAAQNQGIQQAARLGAEFVLLLDQDSQPSANMVQLLSMAFSGLTEQGLKVAAVGPSFVDPRCNLSFPFARLRHVRMQTAYPPPGHAVECDILISSGCLVSMAALRELGDMDASLFIDYVDIEWCLRARAAGWKVFGVADATMQHTIGDRAIKLFGRVIAVHSPVRHYYLIRNAFLFARKPYLTLRWRLHLLYRVAGQFVIFGVLCPNRLRRLAWMTKGTFDGLRGVTGRLGGPAGLGRSWRSRLTSQRRAADELPPSAAVPIRDSTSRL